MFTDREKIEAQVRACYAGWSDNYHRNYYGPQAAYPPVHRDLLRRELLASGATNLLDAGCGSASFLRELADTGIEFYGFDLTPEMVAEGRRVFAKLGLPPQRLWQGSVMDANAFTDPDGRLTGRFDAVVCSGVLPHIPEAEDRRVIAHLHAAARPGGLVLLEARNALFALFTLNRYSMEFFQSDLLRLEQLRAQASTAEKAALDEAVRQLQARFRMDLPPKRTGQPDEPGYDEVLSRTHNPFILQKQFSDQGFRDVRVLFYHYHCLPPMLAGELPDLFRARSLAMEDPNDWRGHFMASAFIVAGVRI
jgi:SAM-dependent methyltransferase